jgi:hypothetical protein
MRHLITKEAADGRDTFCLKCPFLHLQILSVVFHTFLKLITSNKKYTIQNESPNHSPSLKKSTYFDESLVEGLFYFAYYSL